MSKQLQRLINQDTLSQVMLRMQSPDNVLGQYSGRDRRTGYRILQTPRGTITAKYLSNSAPNATFIVAQNQIDQRPL